MLSRLIFATLLTALAALASADDREVFQWTDTEGNVHYSDRPLADNAEPSGVKTRTTDSARIVEAKRARIEEKQLRAAAKATAASHSATDAVNADRYAENCRRARAALASILNARRLYVPDEGGGRRYLDKDETTARRTKAEADVSEWCN